MQLKKLLAIVLVTCILFSMGVTAFAGIVDDESTSSKEQRPLCTECGIGYMNSKVTSGYWANTGANRHCIHGKFGFDNEQDLPIVFLSWCDNACGNSSRINTYDYRWECDGY